MNISHFQVANFYLWQNILTRIIFPALIIPHFIGAGAPHWNPFSKGIIFGLALGHKRRDIYRAVLEGVAYEIRKNIEVFKELGLDIKELKLTGGGSRSDFWNQIYSDVLGITCVRNTLEESTSLGAAILAASGAGMFPDIVKAAQSLCKVDKKWIPDVKKTKFYDGIYKYSNNLYETLNSKQFYKSFTELNKLDKIE